MTSWYMDSVMYRGLGAMASWYVDSGICRGLSAMTSWYIDSGMCRGLVLWHPGMWTVVCVVDLVL